MTHSIVPSYVEASVKKIMIKSISNISREQGSLLRNSFFMKMRLRETFKPPFDGALCISVINNSSGIIGYRDQGIKRFEIGQDSSVKVSSIKQSKNNHPLLFLRNNLT